MSKLDYGMSDIYPGYGGMSTSEAAIPEATEREHYGEAEGFSPLTTANKPKIYGGLLAVLVFIVLLNL